MRNRVELKKQRTVWTMVSLGLVFALTQGCGTPMASAPALPQPTPAAPSAAVSATASGILSLTTTQSQVLPQQPFVITADLSGFPSDTSFIWSHDFGIGLTFCNQSTPLTNVNTTIECPTAGTVTVQLKAISSSGVPQFFSLAVQVGGPAPGTIPGPNPGTNPGVGPSPNPNPNPMPMPSPPVLSAGAQLYNQTCGGCHGNLPGQSNRLGITLSQLQSAIQSVPNMSFLSGQLSLAQEQSIISALNMP